MSSWDDLDREQLRRALAAPAPSEVPAAPREAAVAVLLAAAPSGVEVLLIRRAERPGDPWSGHMALPGGHREALDADLLATAVRETREEIGLDLSEGAELLGRLDDLSPGKSAALRVRPFVFALNCVPELEPSSEVERGVWARLGDLSSGRSAAAHELEWAGNRVRYDAFRVGEHVVWGLTYRVLGALIARANAADAGRLAP